jgi:hypothetical protein
LIPEETTEQSVCQRGSLAGFEKSIWQCLEKHRVVTMSKGNTKAEQDDQHDLN